MCRRIPLALLMIGLQAATVETTFLGTVSGPQPIVGGDGQGNVVLATTQPYSILHHPAGVPTLQHPQAGLDRKSAAPQGHRRLIVATARNWMG